MRLWFYQIFVNRHPGIARRYHRRHDGSAGPARLFSYLYLFWLNFAYYALFCRRLGEAGEADAYEEKRLPVKISESAEAGRAAGGSRRGAPLSADGYLDRLGRFDVISFDLFDTLVFRPFSEPSDLFYVLGEKLDYMDFKRIRMEAEQKARNRKFAAAGSYEVTLEEIWRALSSMTGIPADEGMRLEMETELALCYANPFMQEVFSGLRNMGKRIIITTDMYLPKDFLAELLDKNGYQGYEELYVSCEIQRCKGDGKLFEYIRESAVNNIRKTAAAGAGAGRSGRAETSRAGAQQGYGAETSRAGALQGYGAETAYAGARQGYGAETAYAGARQGYGAETAQTGAQQGYGAETAQTGERSSRVRMAHVGDSRTSDVKMAEKHGFCAFWYPNVNRNSLLYRPYDMSPVVGGAYRGLVNNRICCGDKTYGRYYEYGYIYGGLFAVGYCSFIHEYCITHGIEKVLFLARDGEILKRAYDYLFPEENTVYAYWSRFAAAKLSAGYLKYDFLRKMVRHKADRNLSIGEALRQMELGELAGELADSGAAHSRGGLADSKAAYSRGRPLDAEEQLTHSNAERLEEFLDRRWDRVLEIYKPQRAAAGEWYRGIIGNAGKAAAVDIGWAGSGAAALRTLFGKEWHIPCGLTGIVAGTNTCHSAEPDMSETMLLNGTMVSYMYSASHNRDIWKKHNPAEMYNVYWELLTSSAAPPFKGFYSGGAGGVRLEFLEQEKNPEGIKEIQDGIMEFVRDYKTHFEKYPYMFRISGRDAYAPMMLAAGYGERYLKEINRGFGVTVGVNT